MPISCLGRFETCRFPVAVHQDRWTRCAHTRQVCRAEGAPVLLRSGTALTRILAASRMRSACPSRVGTSLPAAPCLHNRNFNFSSLLCAVGNLEREALPAEAAQRKRFVTRDELMSLAANYRDINTRRARHPRPRLLVAYADEVLHCALAGMCFQSARR